MAEKEDNTPSGSNNSGQTTERLKASSLDVSRANSEEVRRLVEECNARQLELESRNEQLRQTRDELTQLSQSLETLVGTRTAQLESRNRELQREIANRMASEEAARAGRELSDRVIDTVQSIILVLDKQGRIVRYNAFMERLTGIPVSEVEGRDWFSVFIPEDDRDRIREIFRDAVAGKRTEGNINPILTRDGEERLIEWYSSELSGPDGELTHVLAIGQDVTERRILHEQLLTIAEQEHRRIGQQLHDDIGQELVGLDLMLDTLVESLEREGSAETERSRRILDNASRILHKIRILSRGLVAYSIRRDELASRLESLVRQVNELEQVHCVFDCEREVIMPDDQVATQLYHIAQEAVTNAIKHSGVDRIEIRGSLVAQQQRWVLTLQDNGIGMAAGAGAGDGDGLRIMGYRAEVIGATLSVGPAATGGTVVRCEVPVAGSGDGGDVPFRSVSVQRGVRPR
ncbi:MAG: PAS domain S-box protein [Pseudomonadales bacterium]